MTIFDRSALNDGVDGREVLGWALFDAANSGYSTVVLTAVFNVFFVSVICAGEDWGAFAWTCAIAASNLLGIAVMPAVARHADAKANKKLWLAVATALCIAATLALAATGPGTILLAASLIVISNLGYSVGESLNSAFLPELARADSVGKVSGWGWSMGYAGGLVTLALCLAAVLLGEKAGYSHNAMVSVTCIITGVVFAVISLPIFVWTRERSVPQTEVKEEKASAAEKIDRLKSTMMLHRDFAMLSVCGFCYQSGLMTVVTLAGVYASDVMGFTLIDTLIMVLLVNITAAAGAFGFGYVQDALGHKKALALTLLIWIAMVTTAAFATEVWVFWIAANLAGLAMGSSQSAGRAMVSVFAPKKRLAEFYGYWNMALWVAAIAGPMLYGAVTWITGNDQRIAICVTGIFFVIALFALAPINVKRAKAVAEETDRADAAS